MRVIFDTSAFIPKNKPDDEKDAILELTKLLPSLDITICVSRKIIKEYGSKLRLFPSKFRFQEFFKDVLAKARTQKSCRSIPFGNLRIHRIEPKVNLDDNLRGKIEDRCGEYDLEDEKFLELFIYVGKFEDVILVTVAEDLACMAKEVKRLLGLDGQIISSVRSFLEVLLD